jgi:hypothetical protein
MKTKRNKNIFSVFFPYGISQHKETGLWHFINREYNPIGLSGDDDHYKQRMESYCAIRLNGMTYQRILKIVEKHNLINKETDEAIYYLFYSDATKPTKIKDFTKYFEILKAFSIFFIKCQVSQGY